MTLRAAAALATLLLLAGCAVGPDYQRPDLQTPVPEQWSSPTLAQVLPDSSAGPNWRWWESFGDQALNALVDEALLHNNDLAAAAGRVLEAGAQLGGAKSQQWPSIEVGGSASRNRRSTTQTFMGMERIYENYSASATLSYEVDLWGRLSRGKEAAVATLRASQQDRRAVAQALIAGVVSTWLQIQELEHQLALNGSTVASYQRTLDTVEERYQRGLVTALDLHLARQNLAAIKAQNPALRQNLAAARRSLEILAGRYPAGTVLAEQQFARDVASLPPVPAGLPAQLLERRPDVVAAEQRLHAAVAGIGNAKANLYPRISLTGSGGSTSPELSDLFTDPTNIWSLAGNLFMPLINRGATKAQVAAARARADQAVAAFRGTVLQAFAEVENALDQDRYQQEQENLLLESVEQARRSVDTAESRYRKGLENILTALESQRRLYTAESSLLTTQRQRRLARVNLIKALGGPWDTLQPGTPPSNSQGAVQ